MCVCVCACGVNTHMHACERQNNIQPTIQQQKTLAANSGLPSPQFVCLKIKQTKQRTAFKPERNLNNLNMSILFCDLLTGIDCVGANV